jgi:hypothetical protein
VQLNQCYSLVPCLFFSCGWYCLSSHGFVCFHFLCAEFLGESFILVVWWPYIVLVSAYHGNNVPSILNDNFAG